MRKYRSGLAIPDWNYPGYEAPVLRDVNGLAVPHPRQHFAGVVAQVSKAYYVHIRSRHGLTVSQICGYKLGYKLSACVFGGPARASWSEKVP